MFSKNLVIAALLGNISAMSITQMQAESFEIPTSGGAFISTKTEQMVNIESLKQVEQTEQKKLSAIEKELNTQSDILTKLQQKKESEKSQLEKEAKLAAEAEVRRMEAQKKLLDLEQKMTAETKAQQDQESRVRDLELKQKAEK